MGGIMSVIPQVRFQAFLNSGLGRTRRALGEVQAGIYITNGVELQFGVDRGIATIYRNLRPRQWAGPESIWIKVGNPLGSPWTNRHRSDGSGSDDPEPQNILVTTDLVAYYDSPGPSVLSFVQPRVSRIFAVQNFTGWVEGDRVDGRGRSERLCEVVSWHSVISMIDQNWSDPLATQHWQRVRFNGNVSGRGWVDIQWPPEY
jgi:hypothetical protein